MVMHFETESHADRAERWASIDVDPVGDAEYARESFADEAEAQCGWCARCEHMVELDYAGGLMPHLTGIVLCEGSVDVH
jgi:hypothetical protein